MFNAKKYIYMFSKHLLSMGESKINQRKIEISNEHSILNEGWGKGKW